jgi:hypothetical protein
METPSYVFCTFVTVPACDAGDGSSCPQIAMSRCDNPRFDLSLRHQEDRGSMGKRRIHDAPSLGIVAVLLASYGCSAPFSANTISEQLYQGSDATLWLGGVVPVCYDGGDGNNPGLLAQARTLLDTYGWSAVANVQFTGWGMCRSPGITGTVRIHFAHGSNGNTSLKGENALQFTDVTLADDASAQQFTYEVLHEFGHVLGWDHEQQRPDNWPQGVFGGEQYCTQNQTNPPQALIDPYGTYRTPYYDVQSIMSYCTGNPWALSPGDVAGVQAAYGLKTPTTRGQNSSNAAVSRTANNLDAYFAHGDGSIWIAYWYDGLNSGTWPSYQLPNAGPGTAPAGAPIAAVSRAANNVDVFYVNSNGGINDNYWSSTGGWGWLTLPSTAGLATPGEQIAAVGASPGALDVIYAGNDRNLYWSHWSGQCSGAVTQCGWQKPLKVVFDGSVPVGAAVSAVARTADRLDIFYIGADGVPHTSACQGFGLNVGGSCTAYNFVNFSLATGSSCVANPGASIAATARSANNIDIFYPSKQGSICTHYWSQGASWTNFAPLGNGTIGSLASITAVTRAPGNLDIFWMASNAQGTGNMHTAWWYAGSNWGTADLGGTYGGVGMSGGLMGATARTSDNLDIFAPGRQFGNPFSSLTTSYWYSGATRWTSYQTDSY